ncbi:elongation factor 4 [Candidatus Falkowbacteria bacterium RIFOXYD2_FULL_35_9]|uniref:Elongation factor 4 n=1 Tax=Candidatus Falkowbacteria bacterium RIFOXYC2_FULL_36_12 TaxID=1798002 RepID=A0A1F5SZU1_9BACT|nr:MAG: elongation factor 4 [Candidatus Falkowbacteria bacterium RIFOXYB2_FULL_35_7]OGF31741.1 MAG: elongation factor 4 [Candidatus Falkowbacteria bacterium RIFOXYC2_FULL_36_12]OGF34075.1 MAG: elongation factor 4 [Candidatus Falkowbacteria bacterium RIFOXYA2_FULL_35_8]OGF48433.1 MAG: elongation factor 4 [Candidatus Falkowbacteria bacterium RIFOXYD2_FULL_35_9]
MLDKIRNFCIIAHIDHGKSTLADRFLELTRTVEDRKMRNQLLDQMDLEQERGITIKLQPVQMDYDGYKLNLIDTPGHVDFSYEVSRSLAAVEGAILLVDAAQGVQAQTVANLYLAIEQGLEIIPVLNKIDLPSADVEKVSQEIIDLIGCKKEDIFACSAKTGEGVEAILQQVIKKVPGPKQEIDKDLRALIFDSYYDEFKGVVAYLRVFEGTVQKNDSVKFFATNTDTEMLEAGVLKPQLKSTGCLKAGEIGYIITGLKEIEKCRVGDTITLKKSHVQPLAGYKDVKPMVYAGIFCEEGSDYNDLREAINKLKLNDASLMFEPENSPVLGFGFRCGFLGLLHLEIFTERLRREFNLEIVITTPSVAYRVHQKAGTKIDTDIKKEQKVDSSTFIMKNPNEFPDPAIVDYIEEPIMAVDILCPKEYIGNVMPLVQESRGDYLTTEYIGADRVIIHYHIPLAIVIVDFYDKLKSVSSGFASMNYELLKYQRADLVKMDILVAEKPVEAFSTIIYRDSAFNTGKKIVQALKETIPKQQFVIKLQASIGGKVIAAERINALRKDVTAKLYGGDHSRKQKLLNKQKKGKKKMMEMGVGKVKIPQESFIAVMKR